MKRKTLCREAFLIDSRCFLINTSTNFGKKYKKWYLSSSNIVPYRIYDYMFKYHKSNRRYKEETNEPSKR